MEYKNTGSFDDFLLKDLSTDEDIKEWLTISLENFLEDNDLTTFTIISP